MVSTNRNKIQGVDRLGQVFVLESFEFPIRQKKLDEIFRCAIVKMFIRMVMRRSLQRKPNRKVRWRPALLDKQKSGSFSLLSGGADGKSPQTRGACN